MRTSSRGKSRKRNKDERVHVHARCRPMLEREKESAGDSVSNPVKVMSSGLYGNVVAELIISSNVMFVRSVFFRSF